MKREDLLKEIEGLRRRVQELEDTQLRLENSERALRESEERFRTVFEQGPLGMSILRPNLERISINAKLVEMFGYTKEELRKLTFLDLTHHDDLELTREHLDKLLKNEIPFYQIEKRYIRKSGEIIWVRVTLSAVRDSQGELFYLVSMIEEITEHKRAQERLRESEERFRSVFENAAIGIDVVDSYGRVLLVNKSLAEMLGYTEDELLNMTIFDISHPDDVDVSRIKHEKMVHGETESYRFEKRYIRKSGEILWADVSVSAVRGPDGVYVATVGVIADITDRKQAEQDLRESEAFYRSLYDNISDCIFIIDVTPEGRFKFVSFNPAEERAVDMTTEQVANKFPEDLVSKDVADHVNSRYRMCVEKRQTIHYEEELNLPKGKMSFLTSLVPIEGPDGSIYRVIGVARDITEQKSLQRQLIQAQKMEAVGTLAGGIAHDFNNLLQVIIGYSDIVLFNKKPTDPDYERLNTIRRAGKNGAELAKRILAFSRRVEPNIRPVNLNNEIVRVQKMLERTVPKMIRIEILLAENLMTVNADPGQMEQILLNLAVNAQYAMPDGGRLTIETANVTLDEDYSRTHLDVEPGEYVLLTVSDTGHGMDKEVLEHVFEPFYTTKGMGEGTGLGLAMVFGIVKSHKGHIICYSEPGSGTTFKIYLPAIVQEIQQDVADSRQMPAFGTETILLVDDENSVRKLGEEMLRMAGYTVMTATNGREALEIYGSNPDRIGLVLLDLIMPEMGGKQCLEELLKINPRAKVVIGSGYSANGPTKDALASGAKGFVDKPYDVRQILAVVRGVLDTE